MNDKNDLQNVAGGPAASAVEAAAPARRPFHLPTLSGPALGLAAVVGLFVALLAYRGGLGSFLTLDNLRLLFHQNAIQAVLVTGALLVIISGGIDLSVGSVAALAGVSAFQAYVLLLAATKSVEAASAGAVAAGVAVGALCGLVNGLAITGLRLTPFVATLGMMSVARGLAYWLTGRQHITLTETPGWMDALQQSNHPYLFFDPGVWSAALLAAAAAVLLRRTVFGRHSFAIGSNEATARLCGVAVGRDKVVVYTLAGLVAGWAGILALAQGSGSADPQYGVGLELEVIAAAVIGGASLRGGQGTVTGALLGVLILGVLSNALPRCGLAVEVKYVLIGVVVVVNTALSQFGRRRVA
jgi:ribose transport system permease protein